MASDISSGCVDDIDVFEEKEEGELSLEDVSSSEESHLNYRSGFRIAGQCKNCMAPQCAPWCMAARAARKSHRKLDAAHGKENRRHIKDSAGALPKHMVATLQEKNDDLVPISSDSDMEVIGLPGNSKQLYARSKSVKIRKKKKKKRSHSNVVRIDDPPPSGQVETYLVDVPVAKKVRLSRAHYREPSPMHRSVRSPLEWPLARSPPRRYRASRLFKSRSPLRRSRSPGVRLSPGDRKSPRKQRSPRRSLSPRSSVRSGAYRDAREHAPPSPQAYGEFYVRLLKKVRRLESVSGDPILSRTKEHSSLKEKLSNMMKNQAEGTTEKLNYRKRTATSVANNNNNSSSNGGQAAADTDDEDNIEVLRRLALETKPKKSENKTEETKASTEVANAQESDDNDIEANELRILALRSAIMKKHEKRVTRGVKSKRPARTRVESPFNESFLDDIRISGDEDSSGKSPAARSSPILDEESNHQEDMDLDTDIEREKEKDLMPYSPTDELTRDIVVDADFSVINDNNNDDEKLSFARAREDETLTLRPLSEKSSYVASVEIPNKISEFPSNMSERSVETNLPQSRPGDAPFAAVAMTSNADELASLVPDIANTQTPFPLANAPLDSELFPIFPNLPVAQSQIEGTRPEEGDEISTVKVEETTAVVLDIASSTSDESVVEIAVVNVDSKVSLQPQGAQKIDAPDAPLSRVSLRSIDAIDKLPEIDLDGSPLVPVSKELEGADLIIPIENMPDISDPVSEPLYLRCLSDVAKDSNKIPTLLNRTLVPAPILKTNKQLQQPLPQKKLEIHAEPSFRSAEMRPVSVEIAPATSATLFKPIKLCPVAKKSQVMTTVPAAAFDASSATDPRSGDDTAGPEPSPALDESTAAPETSAGSGENLQKADEKLGEKKTSARSKKQRRRLREKTRAAEASNCAKTTNTTETSGDSGSLNTSGKRVGDANKFDEQATRASIRNSLVKSWENFQQTVQKQPPGAAAANNAASKAGEKKRKTRRSKRKLRNSSSSCSLSNKSSELDATKNSEQSDEKSAVKKQADANKSEGDSSGASEESKKPEEPDKNRRCSVDEDEEALRAQLLASLPKRPKHVEVAPAAPAISSVAKNSQQPDAKDANVENPANKPANEPSARSTEPALAPANPSVPPSHIFNAVPATLTKPETLAAASKSCEAAAQIFESQSNNSVAEPSTLTLLKRPSSTLLKGPPKKIVKKVLPTLASTRVVNNAKKYQNALLQRKLSVQRPAMNYGAQKGSRNITLNNLKNSDAVRPSSPKISAASKTEPIIIRLGSDSDSEPEFSGEPAPSFGSSNALTEVRQPLQTSSSDFAKQVDQFLKNAREKAESVNQTANTTTMTTATTTPLNKTTANFASAATENLSGIYNTPLAVRRHLPISQQQEYRRLKQEIMEREKQKLQKQAIENGLALQNPSSKSSCTPPGPLSPAGPIAATQKSHVSNKLLSVTTQAAPSPLVPSSTKDKVPEKLAPKKVVELANENRTGVTNITNVTKTMVPAFPSKQLTTPPAASSKINSNIPNVPSKPLPAKVPIKSLPKGNPINPNANIPAMSSTPKAQPSAPPKAPNSIYLKTPLTLAKGAASTTKVHRKFVAEASYAPKVAVEPSTSLSACNEAPRSLGAISVSSVPATTANSATKSSLHPAEMLTIRIANDKLQTERVASTGISKGESSSPPNGRNVGAVKVLTKEQLNSRLVKVQVKQGSPGRIVTVGGPLLSQGDAARSASCSPLPKVLPEGPSDKVDKTMCCDSSLIVNESTATKNEDKRLGESRVAGPEDSTLVLSRQDEHYVDSNASTLALAQDNSRDDMCMDSASSTFVFVHNNSECRGSPGISGTEKHEDEMLAANPKDAEPTKNTAKIEREKIWSEVKRELEILTALPPEQQRTILIESQENLVAKQNMVLDDLLEMSTCLRQWEAEREIQTKLIAEVQRLREQLEVAEKRMHEQRAEMNSMGPKVSRAHEKICHDRREWYKLSRICHGLGVKVIGEDYKEPDNEAQLVNQRLKEVAVHTRQLLRKKVPPIGSPNYSTDAGSPISSICSDNLSESSFSERPSVSTTPVPEATNLEQTKNSSSIEMELDDANEPRENSEPAETSGTEPPRQNSNSERVNPSVDEKSKSSEANAPSEETTETVGAKEEAQTTDKAESSAREANAHAKEKEESRPEVDGPSNETEASNAPDRRADDSSDLPGARSIGEKRAEDISMPSTSKYYPHRQLTSSDALPKRKSKIDPYESVLTHMKIPRSVNPDGILCPYELMGTCSDVDCQFYHLNPGHCQ